MFRAHVLIMRRSKLHYTASGIITPIGGRLVHRLRELLQSVHEKTTCRCDDTIGCVMQFWPPDDGHMCSKHVEVWNKLIVKQKFCVSSWLNTEINILRCTVSKTSKNESCFLCQFHNTDTEFHNSQRSHILYSLSHPYIFLISSVKMGVNSKYCPGWICLKFIMNFHAVMNIECAKPGRMWGSRGPCIAPRREWKGQTQS